MTSLKEILKSLQKFRDELKKYPPFEQNLFELERILQDANSSPTVMVMGVFSAGKSTFINALLGDKVLDTSAIAATAVITKIVYGDKDKVAVHFKDGTKAEYSTKDFAELTSDKDKKNLEVRRKINYVEREYPSQLLKKFTFVDSPGLNAPNDLHEETTKNFLSNADAVVWIVDTNQAISAKEMKYLENLPARLKPIVVVNKIDELDEDEDGTPEEFLADIRKKIRDKSRIVLGISARQALQGKLKNNSADISESNIQAVLNEIEKIISADAETYKVKSLLKSFGLYLRRLNNSIDTIKKRIAPIRDILPEEYEKFISAISKVTDAVKIPVEHLKNCNIPADSAEKIFFDGILNYSKHNLKYNFSRAAQEGIVEAQMMLGNFEQAAKSGNAEAQFKFAEQLSDSAYKVALYQMSAEKNFADAQYWLAKNSNSLQEKFTWCKKAAENGHALAQLELAKIYETGKGTTQDNKLAFYWYNKALEQGLIDAIYFIAQCYLNGRGTRQNFKSAFQFHSIAAKLGNIAASFEVAKAYFYGNGVEKNSVKAFVLYNEANRNNSAPDYKFLEDNYYNGSAEVQFILANAYETGKDIEKNLSSAIDWYKKAANQGHTESLYRLAQCYKLRSNNGLDLQNTFYYYTYLKAASDKNHSAAKSELQAIFNNENFAVLQYQIAQVLRNDLNNLEESFTWYLQAAKHNYSYAQYIVGTNYKYGYGVQKNIFKAFWWLKKAAENGYTDAINDYKKIEEKIFTGIKKIFVIAAVIFVAFGLYSKQEEILKFFSKANYTSPVKKIESYEKNARSELSVGGVCIDDTVARMHEVLGKERKITQPYGKGSHHYHYDDIEFAVANGKVDFIKTKTPKLKTKRGLHQGSKRTEVLKIYGKPMEFVANGMLYYEYWGTSPDGNRCLLRFAMVNDVVNYVGVRIYQP